MASKVMASGKKLQDPSTQTKKKGFLYYLKRDKFLYLLILPSFIFLVIFRYTPMYGIIIAFQDYNIFQGVLGSEFVGFEVFERAFGEERFWLSVRNTIVLNVLLLLVMFPLTIILSLMLNEVIHLKFKRLAQSLLYLPHFVSWVVIAGLAFNMFSTRDGSINNIIKDLGFEPIPFLVDEGWWIFTYVLSNTWKDIGWGTIIYLAALTGVDEALYEAAYIDGATKLQRILYITIPSIKPTVVVMFILQLSRMMSIGLDAPLLLGNDGVIAVSEVISTYVYDMGLLNVQYSFATAVGLFQSVINVGLLLLGQRLAKAIGEDGIF